MNEDAMRLATKNFFCVLFICCFTATLGVAQDSVGYSSSRKYDFLMTEENSIHNSVALSGFYENLYRLKKKDNLKVNIIHIGDSHIQADFFSEIVRQNLQHEFGNGGRGLIVPGRVARTNEPSSIRSSSPSTWEVKRCVYPDQPLPIGIGGITIRSTQPDASLALQTFNSEGLDYSFNKLTLFFHKDFTSYNFIVQDSVKESLAFVGPFTLEQPNVSTVLLPVNLNKVTIQAIQSLPVQTQAIVFGINLENGKPGIVYHAIGVNGAKYKHYAVASPFADQASALLPDLIIISLGTNEALDHPYLDAHFIDYVQILIQNLKAKNPQAQFLFTTPPDAYRKKTRRNPGIEAIRKKIIAYCDQYNHAYWDLYQIGGGTHSADLWKKNGLLRADGVHFTKEGYELQGNLLYEALIKGYNEYVRYRHP